MGAVTRADTWSMRNRIGIFLERSAGVPRTNTPSPSMSLRPRLPHPQPRSTDTEPSRANREDSHPEQHPDESPIRALTGVAALISSFLTAPAVTRIAAGAAVAARGDGAAGREEEDLDGDGEAGVQADDGDKEHLRGTQVGRGEDGIPGNGKTAGVSTSPKRRSPVSSSFRKERDI